MGEAEHLIDFLGNQDLVALTRYGDLIVGLDGRAQLEGRLRHIG